MVCVTLKLGYPRDYEMDLTEVIWHQSTFLLYTGWTFGDGRSAFDLSVTVYPATMGSISADMKMKIAITLLVCMIHFNTIVSENDECWRTKIVKIRRDYKNGENPHVAWAEAMNDIKARFVEQDKIKVITTTDVALGYDDVYKTITLFTLVSKPVGNYTGYARTRFFDKRDVEVLQVSVTIAFDKDGQMDKTAFGFVNFTDINSCEEGGALNGVIFPSFQ
ncbi:hypothetical protein KIN20_028152 [Parelaphostrongylus tenuis]|uniref:Uncharacterized protein n=1 Tax=Parelaphostrongylus tenuis TaxID=148309 RepID=A0AAD5R131_PARTN|nr:hypothetical protein KIN20_028152 [Parelaphostrongylus tenuis]